MEDYRLSPYERETCIYWNDEEQTAELYTCNKIFIKKMDEKCLRYPDNFKLIKKDSCSATYRLNSKKLVTIRNTIKRKELTTEQKHKLKKQMLKNFSKVHND